MFPAGYFAGAALGVESECTAAIVAAASSGIIATPTNITAGTITTVSGNVNGNVSGSVSGVSGNVKATDTAGNALATATALNSAATSAAAAASNTSGLQSWMTAMATSIGYIPAAVWNCTTTSLDGLTSITVGKWFRTVLGGMTSLAKWLSLIMGKSPDATGTLAEVQATPAGATYNNTSMSEQAIVAALNSSTPVGPGAILTTLVINNTSNTPVANVNCWITSDSAGETTIAGTLQTNSMGVVAFLLDEGTCYLWRQSATYQFPSPQTLSIAGSSESITFADGTIIAGPASGYAVRSDLENIFGIPNIIKWALLSPLDPDSDAGMAEITGRINWAIGVASVDFENAMRQGRYTLPVTGTGASVWATTVVATLAGYLLYQHLRPVQRGEDGRPIPDRYDGIFTWAELQMNWVRAGKLRLDAAVFGKGTNAPEVIHERSRGAYGPGIGGYGRGPLPPPGPFIG